MADEWQRARTSDQIEAREQSILAAARRLFRKVSYEELSLNAIAREAGLAKSGVYRYFSSREEIFLTIFRDLLLSWSRDCARALDELPPHSTPDACACQWVKVAIRHQPFLELMPLLFHSLERNSSAGQVMAFKRDFMKVAQEQHLSFLRHFPGLDLARVREFLTFAHCLLAGLWSASRPNPTLDALYRKAEFRSLRISFEEDALKAVGMLLREL